MNNFSLTHEERLRSRSAIRRLFESGHHGFVYPLRYMWIADQVDESHSPHAEVMFSVPKRFHKRANKRNLLRRRIKESYRLQKHPLSLKLEQGNTTIDLALIYTTKEAHNYKTINNAVRKVMDKISEAL